MSEHGTMPAGTRRRLTGWGRTAPSVATVILPTSTADVSTALAAPASATRGMTARGLGRAYGDAAQNGGGTVLDCTALTSIGAIEAHDAGATITVGGGVSLDAVMRAVVASGWALPVLPGTRHVTVGGAIASDVHGKSHHVDGSFGAHVEAFTLAFPGGEQREVTRASDAALFEATAGGMGFTGVVVSARLRLTPIETRYLHVRTARTHDLDATMRALADADAVHRHSVAWIDLATSHGRGIVSTADPARFTDLPSELRIAPLEAPVRRTPTVLRIPANLITRASVRLFNKAWYWRPRPSDGFATIEDYSAPLDRLGSWNHLYGPRGFLQYQCAIPAGEESTLRAIAEAISNAPAVPALAVLKHLGPGGGAPLSFPIEGWTLAVDFPAVVDRALGGFFDTLDQRVAAAGGRVYLTKDARMRPEMVPLMYPRIDAWREVQARVDPDGVLTSDLDRRLRLTARSAR